MPDRPPRRARTGVRICLARDSDSETIALMSRELIETGLGWSWTATRVSRSITCTDTLSLVGQVGKRVVAFALTDFGEETAHLSLLAVAPDYRRVGVGRRLVAWMEDTARVAGIRIVRLEVRAVNDTAQAFYEKLGYRKVRHMPGYYAGREAAVRMEHHISCSAVIGEP